MISDYELELHFNSMVSKYPIFYALYSFDTTNWTDNEKETIQKLIDKWNAQLQLLKSDYSLQDDGVSPIVSQPYKIDKKFRLKAYRSYLEEKYKRATEFYELMANYEENNV